MKQRDNICLYFMQYANRVLLSKLREMRKRATRNARVDQISTQDALKSYL